VSADRVVGVERGESDADQVLGGRQSAVVARVGCPTLEPKVLACLVAVHGHAAVVTPPLAPAPVVVAGRVRLNAIAAYVAQCCGIPDELSTAIVSLIG
jgi:hypothetical protein